MLFSVLLIPRPQRSTLFPYTTLFRSVRALEQRGDRIAGGARVYRAARSTARRSEEHTSELQSLTNLVCRLLLEKKNTTKTSPASDPQTRGRITRPASPPAPA